MVDVLNDLKSRINQSTRTLLKIRQMERNAPLPMKQVYGDDQDAVCRDRVRYHRNLYRYKMFYREVRIPLLDPTLEDLGYGGSFI